MTRHQAAHRATRRRAVNLGRVGALVAAVAMTLVIGTTSVVAQLRTDPASAQELVADVSEPSLLAATLPPVQETEQASPEAEEADDVQDPAPPRDSGEGRRVVFSQGQQRVWILDEDETVRRTYLVSGSKHDNLDPGSYTVTARHRNATAFDYSGTMEFFVQFTSGDNAPIGFHDVPRDNAGDLEQTKDELGTPLSAGCVRQWRDDAVALWKFADEGTPVVVTAA